MNKCMLVGNLTRDPELATTMSGISVCRFSIAVNRPYTNANGERDVDYLNIVTWRGLADNCSKYLSKGNKVGVTGTITTRSYETDDGDKRYVTEIVAEEVEFIKTKTNDQDDAKTKGKNKTAAEIVAQGAVDGDNDFPF